MFISFATKVIRQLCEDSLEAEKILGGKVAEKLRNRLADLDAAKVVTDLIAGMPSQLDGHTQKTIKINLTSTAYLEIQPNHSKVPRRSDGFVDWSKVQRVKILRIEAGNV